MTHDPVQELIHVLVCALVEHPDEVHVRPIEGDGTVVYEVQVHPEDNGKVIGKKGRTINSLRTILRAASLPGEKRIMMELV
ncbi:MAG TPA: KH domain-containing protein [Candidatus Ozemobacteraceae bacterium]